MTLGERICAHRTNCGLSQSDLAERLEVSRQSVSKWETDTSVPDLDRLVKMCELFQVSLDQLVRGDIPSTAPADLSSHGSTRLCLRVIIGLMLLFFGLVIFTALFVFRGAGLDDALVWSAPLLVTGGRSLNFPKHPVLAAFWGLWGLYTLILLPFLFWAPYESAVFLPGNLTMAGVLVVVTRNRKKGERKKENR